MAATAMDGIPTASGTELHRTMPSGATSFARASDKPSTSAGPAEGAEAAPTLSYIVSIGPAIDTVGRTPEEVNEQTEAWIEGEMRRLFPQYYKNAPKATRVM